MFFPLGKHKWKCASSAIRQKGKNVVTESIHWRWQKAPIVCISLSDMLFIHMLIWSRVFLLMPQPIRICSVWLVSRGMKVIAKTKPGCIEMWQKQHAFQCVRIFNHNQRMIWLRNKSFYKPLILVQKRVLAQIFHWGHAKKTEFHQPFSCTAMWLKILVLMCPEVDHKLSTINNCYRCKSVCENRNMIIWMTWCNFNNSVLFQYF